VTRVPYGVWPERGVGIISGSCNFVAYVKALLVEGITDSATGIVRNVDIEFLKTGLQNAGEVTCRVRAPSGSVVDVRGPAVEAEGGRAVQGVGRRAHPALRVVAVRGGLPGADALCDQPGRACGGGLHRLDQKLFDIARHGANPQGR